MCSKVLISLWLSLSSSLALAGSGAAPTAEELLQEADRARGGLEQGIRWELDLLSKGDGSEQSVHYIVKAYQQDALVEATAPGRNKGETMLFNDKNLWFFKPGIKKPVAISPRQKLMGQAANGDIAATN